MRPYIDDVNGSRISLFDHMFSHVRNHVTKSVMMQQHSENYSIIMQQENEEVERLGIVSES